MKHYRRIAIALALSLVMQVNGQNDRPRWSINGKSNLISVGVRTANQFDWFGANDIGSDYAIMYESSLALRRILNRQFELELGAGITRAGYAVFGKEYQFEDPVDGETNLTLLTNGAYREFRWQVGARYYRKRKSAFAPMGSYYRLALLGTQGTIHTGSYEGLWMGTPLDEFEASTKTRFTGLLLGFGKEMAIADGWFFGLSGALVLGRSSTEELQGSGIAVMKSEYGRLEKLAHQKNAVVIDYSLSYLF